MGSLADDDGTGVTTLSVSPQHVGDLVALSVRVSSSSISVSSISGGGVSTWTRREGPYSGYGGNDFEIWTGVVSSTGSSTVTVSFSGSVASDGVELTGQEFSAASGSSTTWGLDTGAGVSNSSSTTVTFPTLTPSGSGELYFGFAQVDNTGSAGSTSGFTYDVTSPAENVVTYDPNVSAAATPTASQSPAGTSGAAAVLMTATNSSAPTVTAVSPSSGSTAGGTSVALTGTNFTGATAVTFGTTPASSFTVNSSTSITATSPAGAASTVDITVTNSAAVSATNSADHFTYGDIISAVGSLADDDGTGVTTLSVSPQHVGDLVALSVRVSSSSISVSSISGGGVSTWTRREGPYSGYGGNDFEIWTGVVSSTGSSTVTVSFSGSVASDGVELTGQEFSAASGSSTTWGLDTGAGVSNSSSTTVTFPTLTPSGSGELYSASRRWTTRGRPGARRASPTTSPLRPRTS